MTLNEQEEKAIDKIIAAISDYIRLEAMQTVPASNPGIVPTRTQIFEAVWNMNSNSCHSSVVNVIYNLRKKIEPDSKNPVYIKTVLGVGYKFNGLTPGNDD